MVKNIILNTFERVMKLFQLNRILNMNLIFISSSLKKQKITLYFNIYTHYSVKAKHAGNSFSSRFLISLISVEVNAFEKKFFSVYVKILFNFAIVSCQHLQFSPVCFCGGDAHLIWVYESLNTQTQHLNQLKNMFDPMGETQNSFFITNPGFISYLSVYSYLSVDIYLLSQIGTLGLTFLGPLKWFKINHVFKTCYVFKDGQINFTKQFWLFTFWLVVELMHVRNEKC